jgi:trimeric autotransporter adhesin
MFTGRKLALTLAFTVLVALAFGVSCKGFFVKPTLTSIAINPTAPQVNVGSTTTLTVFGTYDDGTRSVVTSGVSWSSDTTAVATIGTTTGVLTGVSPGNAGISASAQALSATASATVILTGATLAVTPVSATVKQAGTAPPFTFTATSGTTVVDITTDNGGTLTIPTSATLLTCTPSNGTEVCSADATTPIGTYTLTMTYAGATNSASATLTVTQ